MQPNVAKPESTRPTGTSFRSDVLAGASMGALLGLLMGFTTSPVVSIVVTGLVALLAGLFGLSDKLISSDYPVAAARRLSSFALTAVLITPLAIWVRTHEVLGPTADQQRQQLLDIGITDTVEQKEMLRYLRFGLLPTGASASAKDTPAVGAGKPVLYSAPSKFCNDLLGLRTLNAPSADFLTLFADSGDHLSAIGRALAALPENERQSALDAAPMFLCAGDA